MFAQDGIATIRHTGVKQEVPRSKFSFVSINLIRPDNPFWWITCAHSIDRSACSDLHFSLQPLSEVVEQLAESFACNLPEPDENERIPFRAVLAYLETLEEDFTPYQSAAFLRPRGVRRIRNSGSSCTSTAWM